MNKQNITDSRSRLGPLLRSYRKTNNIQQKDLTTILKLSKSQISKLEAGLHKPNEDTVIRILELLMPDFKSNLLLLEAEAYLNINKSWSNYV